MYFLVENNNDITLKKILEDFFNKIGLRVGTHISPKIPCKNLTVSPPHTELTKLLI